MELTVLGSGTVAPSKDRCAPAHWVAADDVRLMLDCGSGALHRAATFEIPWYGVTHVAITHFHTDHWTDLPLLLFALRWGYEPARSAPLHLMGPVGLTARLHGLATAFGDWVLDPGYPLVIDEIPAGENRSLSRDVRLESCSTPHTEESMAYAVRHNGAHLVYTGDTGPSDEVAIWARNCDVLLCECSLPEDRAIALHLTPAQAGSLAREAHAARLVLTHFYPPVEEPDPASLAAEVFDGVVVAARDGDRFTIGTER